MTFSIIALSASAGSSTQSAINASVASGIPLISQGVASTPLFGTATVPGGGTGAITLTSNGVLLGNGTSPVTASTAGTNGQVFLGGTGVPPAFATLTSTGGTIAFTLGSNTLDMQVVGGGIPWTNITGATQTLAINNGYVTNRAGGVAYTLPSTAREGDIIRVAGKAGAWTIAQNALQQINLGSASTTVGVTGSIASTDPGDCVEMLCTTTGSSTVWRVISSMGNIKVT